MNTGKHTLAWLLGLLTVCASPALAQEDAPLRFARVTAQNARIVNLPDANGIDLAQPGKGTLVSVWRELAGWLEVEVPGGYLAWVHGRYLAPTDGAGIHEVTRNAINIRPLPKSDVTSFPLPQRLHAGDRVRVVAIADEKKPLAETWARIVTPPGVHAWIRADEVTTLAADERGPELWAQALAAAAGEVRGEDVVTPAPREATGEARGPATAKTAEPSVPAPASGVAEATRAELTRLAAAIDQERGRERPDYTTIERELSALSATAPSGALRLEIDGELARLDALKEVAQVKSELERERQRREQEVWERERQVREASRAKDPLGSVYLSRGVLLRTTAVGDAPRYTLRFGGREVCEVLCTSGRYDLDLLSGYEVGVFGDALQSATERALPVVEVRRLEVLKRR